MTNSADISEEFLKQASLFGLSEEEATSFYKALGREPTKEETAVCGALWSEHCSYKSSRVHLKRFHTQEPWVLQGPGENAGAISINNDYAIVFKMESHNHPSYIEPYEGAATGVGGILRDIFCMGASPIANLNCLRYGEGARHATLLKQSVRGIGDYGNSVGIPTVGGDTSFHCGYNQNILINAFTAGIVHKNKIFKGILSEKKLSHNNLNLTELNPTSVKISEKSKAKLFPEEENVIIYFGSSTGRDGVHGATMSSSEFSGTHVTLKPTVQVGDPFAEKILIEATFSLIEKKLVVGLQDMGAAGLTSSSVEMAGRSGCGVAIDLNKVPQRASNMQAWEILLSESQERMLCAALPSKVNEVLEELKKFDISYAVIGKVNNTGLFTCLFDDKITTAIPILTLVENAPYYKWPLQEREEYLKNHKEIKNTANEKVNVSESLSLNAIHEEAHKDILNKVTLNNFLKTYPQFIEQLFSHPTFASREPIFHHYCSTVQGNTVTGAGAIKSSSAPVVRLPRYAQENTQLNNSGIALAGGCEERFVDLDPYTGSALSVLKIARKIVAVGGIPLAMTDCLNFGSPKSPEVMRQISDSIDGINTIAKEFHIPIISGNVSLNNQTSGKGIPPTPMLGIVGKVNNVQNIPLEFLPSRFFQTGQCKSVYLVHISSSESVSLSSYNASQVAWLIAGKNSECPQLNIKLEKTMWELMFSTIEREKPIISLPIGHGGLLGSLVSMALKSRCELKLEEHVFQTSMCNLFAEGNMGFIIGFKSMEQSKKFIAEIQASKKHDELNLKIQAEKIAQLLPKNSQLRNPVFNLQSTIEHNSNSLKRFFS